MTDSLRALAIDIVTKMEEPQLKRLVRELLQEELVVPPPGNISYAAPTDVKRSTFKAKKKERPSAPITKVLRGIGRGFKADIFAYLQDKLHYPVPKDPDEVTRWMDRSLSRYSDRIRTWPDGSYSLLDYELPAPAEPN